MQCEFLPGPKLKFVLRVSMFLDSKLSFHIWKVELYCSDFRYESNGIFVLGVGFFSSDKFRLFN